MPKMDAKAFQKLEDQKSRDEAASHATGPDKVAAEVKAIGLITFQLHIHAILQWLNLRISINLILNMTFFFTKASKHHQSMCLAPVQQRAVLKRFIDSLLTKMNKIRTLLRDLKTNYPDDPTV